MDKMKWIIFAVLVVVLFGGVYWLNKSDKPTFTGDVSKIITQGPIADRTYGSPDQKVVLIEYGDFQCPACGRVFEPIKALKEQYKDKLTFVFRNFPLTNSHPNALAAATVAEAAGQQGKFWEMHDLLYANQSAWSEAAVDQRAAIFEGYAASLGLDITRYKQDLASKEVSDKVARDRSTGASFPVDSTPTFVINGKRFDPTKSTDVAALTAEVEAALKAAYPGFTPVPTATTPEATQ